MRARWRCPYPESPTTLTRAWSTEQLAAALAVVGVWVTARTLRNWIAAGDLPARRNRQGDWRVSDATVRRRWPSIFLLRAAA